MPLLLALLAACGQSSGPPVACKAVGDQRVEQVTGATDLSAVPDESPGLSVCHWRGDRVSVRVSIDEAPRAPRRYFNRLAELWQFHGAEPERAPRLVYGVGDDRRALGGAGAYWLRATNQLLAQRGERLVIVTLDAPRLRGERAERAAETLARAALKGAGGSEGGGPGPSYRAGLLEVLSPSPGALVRTPRVEIAGTAVRGARIEVDGRAAAVRGGIWRRRLPLARGKNSFHVEARAGTRSERRTVVVERGRPADAVAATLARRSRGRLPDLRTESVDVALAVLRRVGARAQLVPFSRGPVRPERWSVCRTRPFPDARLRRGQRVTLWVAPSRLDRSSGTDCAQES